MAFAADGRLFFTERLAGRVRVMVDGRLLAEPVAELPVAQAMETGLLGLALHPQFPRTPYLYVYYTAQTSLGALFNRVVRLRLSGNTSVGMEVVLDRIPGAAIHNGGILAFGPDDKLYVTTGDATRSGSAQDLGSLAGKVLRLDDDGTIPQDNPFVGSPVYTYGHRNVFGLAFHPKTGAAYITENGPQENDEVNLLRPGANYGWPLVTGMAGDPRFVDPLLTFTPNIAPTQALFSTGGKLDREYQGDLFFGDWNLGGLHRVLLGSPQADRVAREDVVYRHREGGIVGLAQGPDGYLYFSTADAIYRLR